MSTKGLVNVGLPKSAMPGAYPTVPTTTVPKARHAVYMKRLWNESGYPWELVPYLVAESATERVLPAGSEARLAFRHGRVKPWDVTVYSDLEARARHDWYVCIMSVPEGSATTLSPSGRAWPLWCGIVPAHNFHVGGSRRDGTGVIKHGEEYLQAVGFEYLLDRRRLTCAHTRKSDGTDNSMGRMPAFNERLKRGPSYPGNRSESKIEVGNDEVTYGFGSELNAYGLPYQWSLVDIVEYLLYWSNPSGTYEPKFKFSAPDADDFEGEYDLHSYLDSVYDQVQQSDKSVLAILKTLFDRRRGFGAQLKWSINKDTSSAEYGFPSGDIEVAAFSCAAEGATVGDITFPPNPYREHIILDEGFDIVDAQASVDSVNTYDKIVVRGRMVSCFSLDYVGPYRALFEKAWDDATETAYRAEVTSEETAGTRTADEKRKHEKYRRVYAAFRLHSDFDWTDAQGRSLNPTFDVNGNIQLDEVGGGDAAHVRFLDWLPITAQSATLAESNEANLQEPLAIVEQLDDDGLPTLIWHLANNVPKNLCTSARIIPGDREGLMWVHFEPKHLLGRGYFNPSTDETDAPPIFTFGYMCLTVAVEAPSCPTVTIETLAPPLLGPTPVPILQRTGVIDVPEAQVWVVAPATVIGVRDNGMPQYHSGNRVTRDDTDRLRTVAALAKAVYGKRRTTVRMTRRGLLGGGCLGRVVKSVSIAQEKHDVNSPMTERSWDFAEGTTSIQTGWIELDVRALR